MSQLPPQLLRYPSVKAQSPVCAAPTAYPSVSGGAVGATDVLVPLVGGLRDAPVISVPVAGTERAHDLVQRLSGSAIPLRGDGLDQPPTLQGSLEALQEGVSLGVDLASSYFPELLALKEAAYAIAVEQINRYRRTGRKLTDDEFRDLLVKMQGVRQTLERWTLPITRYEVMEFGRFKEMARFEAMLRTLPPERVPGLLESNYLAIRSRYMAGAWDKSLAVARTWTKRAATAAAVLLVIDFVPTVITLFTARSKEEADEAVADLVVLGAEVLTGVILAKALPAAAGALGVVLVATPAGWIVAGAGLLAGAAAGVFFETQLRSFVKPLIEVNPYAPRPLPGRP